VDADSCDHRNWKQDGWKDSPEKNRLLKPGPTLRQIDGGQPAELAPDWPQNALRFVDKQERRGEPKSTKENVREFPRGARGKAAREVNLKICHPSAISHDESFAIALSSDKRLNDAPKSP
jgi:hypothetical protein